MTEEVRCYRRASLILLAILLAAMVVLPPMLSFSLDYKWLLKLLTIAAILILASAWAAWRRLDPIRPVVEVTTIILMMMPPILVCTFAAMRFDLPLVDPLLIRMDEAIGFDWPTYVRWMDTIPFISHLLEWTYESAFYQLVLLPLLLCAIGRPARAYQLALAYGLLCSFSSAVAAFFPSVGAYSGHGLDGGSLVNVNASNGHFFLASFEAVRSDPDFVLGARTAAGILTFPSVHAGIAALFAWAAWPSPTLRYPVSLLNILMAVSAITHGAHYLVDIFAGFIVALIVVITSSALVRKNHQHYALNAEAISA